MTQPIMSFRDAKAGSSASSARTPAVHDRPCSVRRAVARGPNWAARMRLDDRYARWPGRRRRARQRSERGEGSARLHGGARLPPKASRDRLPMANPVSLAVSRVLFLSEPSLFLAARKFPLNHFEERISLRRLARDPAGLLGSHWLRRCCSQITPSNPLRVGRDASAFCQRIGSASAPHPTRRHTSRGRAAFLLGSDMASRSERVAGDRSPPRESPQQLFPPWSASRAPQPHVPPQRSAASARPLSVARGLSGPFGEHASRACLM